MQWIILFANQVKRHNQNLSVPCVLPWLKERISGKRKKILDQDKKKKSSEYKLYKS